MMTVATETFKHRAHLTDRTSIHRLVVFILADRPQQVSVLESLCQTVSGLEISPQKKTSDEGV